MKYLLINVVAGSGSTGRIAAEQCRQLKAQGHECVLAYGRKVRNCDDLTTHRIGMAFDYRVHGVLTRLFDLHGFGSKRATRVFLRWVKEYDPDVIWLHNIHGYYLNIELLFDYLKTCGKTIRWTLHDCWAFTGHCAYFSYVGCGQWRTECAHCPQLRSYPKCMGVSDVRRNFVRKKEAFTGVPDMTLVTPSQWLANLVKQSFLREYPVEVAYNRIDTNVFKPTPSDFRERYGLQGKTVVLGVANVWEERKGLSDFIRLASLLDDRYAIVLAGLTEEQIRKMPKQILAFPCTSSTQELAKLYTVADVLFNPTYEDNYPTVNLEAQACGTRVICYDVGGCRETLQNEESMVVEPGNLEKVRTLLTAFDRSDAP